MWRDFLYFSRADRRVLLVFSIVLVLAGSGTYLLTFLSDPEDMSSKSSDREIQTFIRSSIVDMQASTDSIGEKLFIFNPNTADSLTFIRLGLPSYQVCNVLKYRRHGGYFRRPDDFSRIYGLSPQLFARLRPYIKIPANHFSTSDYVRKKNAPYKRDTLHYPVKYTEGTVLDLNQTDTSRLRKIPGIGSYYARRIRSYGERLGGYVSVNQLNEIEGLPEGITRWFVVRSNNIRKININTFTFKQLVSHPYLNYEQVKALMDYRRKYGVLHSLEQLSLYDAFTPEDLKRLAPYVLLKENTR